MCCSYWFTQLVGVLVSTISPWDGPPKYERDSDAECHTATTAVTIKANNAIREKRPFSNTADFDDVKKAWLHKMIVWLSKAKTIRLFGTWLPKISLKRKVEKPLLREASIQAFCDWRLWTTYTVCLRLATAYHSCVVMISPIWVLLKDTAAELLSTL